MVVARVCFGWGMEEAIANVRMPRLTSTAEGRVRKFVFRVFGRATLFALEALGLSADNVRLPPQKQFRWDVLL